VIDIMLPSVHHLLPTLKHQQMYGNFTATSSNYLPYHTTGCHKQHKVNRLFIDLLEDVFEPPIILLENGVLGAHVQRPFLLYRVLETAVGKAGD